MKNRISRRRMLQGSAAAIALPWLECMSSLLSRSRAVTPVTRIAFMYIPNGVITQSWFPEPGSTDFLSPPSLRPLEAIRDQIMVINGLNRTYIDGEPHSQCGSCWLTSARPDEKTEGGFAIDTTLDQLIAREKGQATPFPSLELSCNSFTDNMEPKYFDAISWYGPGHDARSMNDPAVVFGRLFGNAQEIGTSVLDTVLEDAADLRKNLGQNDRRKLDEYLESLRAIERRIVMQGNSRDRLTGITNPLEERQPTNRGEYIRLMGDMMVLAFKTDQTRVATLMVGPERWETPQLYDSVFEKPVNHHQMTHDDSFDDLVARIDRFHVEQFVYLVKKLIETSDESGPLLDNTIFVLGSGLGDGNSHSYQNLPMVIAGGKGLGFPGGRQVQCPEGTPLANLWLKLGQTMGLSLSEFADSAGALSV
jgi:Protein of unknown function (DUF1552)